MNHSLNHTPRERARDVVRPASAQNTPPDRVSALFPSRPPPAPPDRSDARHHDRLVPSHASARARSPSSASRSAETVASCSLFCIINRAASANASADATAARVDARDDVIAAFPTALEDAGALALDALDARMRFQRVTL